MDMTFDWASPDRPADHHCLICNAKAKKLGKEEETFARTLAELIQYPYHLLRLCGCGRPFGASSRAELKVDNKSPPSRSYPYQQQQEFENSAFCADCAKRLREIQEVFQKLVELQKKVDRFQRKVAGDLAHCVKVPSLQTDMRKHMLSDLTSCSRSQTEAIEGEDSLAGSRVPDEIRPCSVRLVRLDQQFGNPLEDNGLIPVELIKQEIDQGGDGASDQMNFVPVEPFQAGVEEEDEPGEIFPLSGVDSSSNSSDLDACTSLRSKRRIAKKQKKKVKTKTYFTRTEVNHQSKSFKCRYPNCGYINKTGRPSATQVNIHVQAYHPKGPEDSPLVCEKCGECFAAEEQRAQHLQESHAASEAPTQIPYKFRCLHCPRSFRVYYTIRDHYKTKHPDQKPPTTTDFPGLVLQNKGTIKFSSPQSCPHCPRLYNCFSSIRWHCQSKHPEKQQPRIRDFPELAGEDPTPPAAEACPHCGFTCNNNPKKLAAHIKRHVKKFSCPVENCGASFNEKEHLRFHHIRIIRNHPELGIPLYKCVHCGAQYHRPSGLKFHLRGKHPQVPPLSCHYDSCNFRTPHQQMLKFHIERVHLQKKNHLCTECGEGFYFRKTFAEHMRKHTGGTKLYMCGVCGKRFSRAQGVKIHEKTHGPVELLFVCELCGFRYPTQTNLLAHIKSWHHGGASTRIGVQPKKKGKYNQDQEKRSYC